MFESLGLNIKNEKELIKNYLKAQEFINKKNEIQFLKTHSHLFNINGNIFTDLNNSLGAIYIVRDPRNIVSSLATFLNISTTKSADYLINGLQLGGNKNSNKKNEIIVTYSGIWNSNFDSWKSFKFNDKYLLIKYEDLIINKENTLKKILKFIYKLKNIKLEIDESKLKNVIKSTSFESMQNLEKEKSFPESQINQETGKKIPFFNLGPKNDWEKLLDFEIIKKLEKAFAKEMKELGYL